MFQTETRVVADAESIVGDIGNEHVISETRQRSRSSYLEESKQEKDQSCFKVITCFAIQQNE